MKTSYLNHKKELILANETDIARQLALRVIEKPLPRVWMIFIPILFVLYFSKLKEYESGLKTFAEHYLIPRNRALEVAFTAAESGVTVSIESLVDHFGYKEANKCVLCKEWLTVLIDHYQLLLNAEGDSYPALVRSGYQNKSNFLLFCQEILRTETLFNKALLETIEGDSIELCKVTDTMAEGIKNLRHQSVEKYFS